MSSSLLSAYGWSDRVAALLSLDDAPEHVPARVSRVDRGSVLAVTEHEIVRARTSKPVATGDWVTIASDGYDGWDVATVLPRWSTLSRVDPEPGGMAEQVLAANVDVVAIVSALDRPVAENRIERMLAMAWQSGATPVVLLTKADAAVDLDAALDAARDAAGAVDVLATSAKTGAGIEEVRGLVAGGRTVALVGPSGAGKSTLVNRLVGSDVQDTGAVREADNRGRHTTTSRELVPLPGGGVLLDTPGIRSLELWGAGEGLEASFDDIDDLAETCRFSDCRHETEPGCAVVAAVADGTLDRRRFESYKKLVTELEAFELRQDPYAQRRQGRQFGRLIKNIAKTDPEKWNRR